MPELVATPDQTIGPFFGYALPYPGDRELAPRGSAGSVRLHGYVYDGEGNGIEDALLEVRHGDPLLASLDAAERCALVAVREADGGLRFDVHLQGPGETPFLSFPGHIR